MADIPFKKMQYVNSGEVKLSRGDTVLNSGAIGSCVVVAAFDIENKIGAMAHIMLPGSSSREKESVSTKYSDDALEEIFSQLLKRGTTKENIKVCLLGGANVLKRKNDTIGNDNIVSVEKFLKGMDIGICAKSLGGTERRTALFDIGAGRIYYTKGDSKVSLLWEFKF